MGLFADIAASHEMISSFLNHVLQGLGLTCQWAAAVFNHGQT